MSTVSTSAIETEYQGIRFRSRLEARWALFFDEMGIKWQYEPEAFALSTGNYLPDFLLTQCGTWVEVRGDPGRVNTDHLERVSLELPQVEPNGGEAGPQLMLVGHIPQRAPEGDWGWIGYHSSSCGWGVARYGFGTWRKQYRPWFLDNAEFDYGNPIEPTLDAYEWNNAMDAYGKARGHRFWNP